MADSKSILSILFITIFSLNTQVVFSQTIQKSAVKSDLFNLIHALENDYVYFDDKGIDLHCLEEYYLVRAELVKSPDETLLLYEYLLDEFYDSHLHLNRNINQSYRLYSPIYLAYSNGNYVVSAVWLTQITNLNHNIVNSTLISMNGKDMDDLIDAFPTHCQEKNDPKVREWLVNKIIAGRYDNSRVLELKAATGQYFTIDLDTLEIKSSSNFLTVTDVDEIPILRFNNSLGETEMIKDFDQVLDSLIQAEAKGLILDLRNTINGGNTYVARAIMGRLIERKEPFQIHRFREKYDSGPEIWRSWVEYVEPRGVPFKEAVVVLVNKWTGSMGEGIAIGLDAMQRASIVGGKMAGLSGEVTFFPFNYQSYGFRVPTARLYHINGTLREEYYPEYRVELTTNLEDEILSKGMSLFDKD